MTNWYFLRYMSDGLARYAKENRVTGITGFSHLGDEFAYERAVGKMLYQMQVL